MAELNERQLILLNSLVYLDANYSHGMTMEALIADLRIPGKLDSMDIGGGMTKEEAKDLLDVIAQDETLMALRVDSSVNTEIRGVCFVNPDNEAVIAYRGTGPNYAAWDDNCQGGYLSDTDMQQEALAFAQNCAQRYDDITVTGHSKGGNMAQYVTVLMGDEIDRCVSFDGQGFSDEFLIKYAKEIAENRDKIRSVCAYNDYVNVLMTPIAKEIVYLDTEETGKGGHFIYDLYKNSKNELDDNGEYVTSRNQAWYLTAGKIALESFLITTDIQSYSNPLQEFLLYTLAGIVMGALISDEGRRGDVDLGKIIQEFLENLEDFTGVDFLNWFSGNQDSYCQVTVNTVALREYGTDMAIAARQIDALSSEIKSLQRKMATNIIKGIAIGLPLQAVMSQLEKECTKLEKLAAFLSFSADQYDTAETSARSSAV